MIPKDAIDHFTKLALVKQTGSNKPWKTDFERITSKRAMCSFSEEVLRQSTAEREEALKKQFCESANLSSQELRKLQEDTDAVDLPLAPIRWQFALGKDLVCPDDIHNLPMRLRQLHQWYKSQGGSEMFGVRYPIEYFGKKDDKNNHTILWIELRALYDFYQQDSLDVKILFLWCL